MTEEEIAETAYSAYGAVVEWKNFRGEPLPLWSDLPTKIQEAWKASCNQAVRLFLESKSE